ncbi:MAG: HlyD family secretion protein, partial [Rhizobium sp.]|nr:HlyD family secretion protein [Rhizobium sp.]
VAAPPAAVATPEPAKKKGFLRRLILPVIVLAAIGAGSWYGHQWWINGRFMVSTDDAYIEGDITNIAPKVTGYVAKVNVVANQHVKAGDVLVTLDNGDYKIAAEQADAQIDTQKLALVRFDAQIAAARSAVAQAEAQKTALEATLRGAEITERRQTDLATKKAGIGADLDNARVALDQAKANLVGADSAILSAQANIAVVTAQRAEAESQIRSLQLTKTKAERDLSFTVLKAPFNGVVGNLAVQRGDLVSPGQRLAALVPVDQLYIEANFKETQVADIKLGAEVEIEVDAISNHKIKGVVASIAPASGAVFSLLPPENATGNFTKVIQRLPVRIAIPKDALDAGNLRAGLSVVVAIDSRTGEGTRLHVAAAK